MPVLLSQTEIKLEWSDIHTRKVRVKAKHSHARSSGTHVSGVIKYVLQTSGLLTVEDEADEFPLRMAIGMAWEEWAVGLWPKMAWQPGEVNLDGVFGSPDGITHDPRGKIDTLEEFKATWKSARVGGKYSDILKQKVWLWQLMAYAKILDLLRARIHILWINGDYQRDFGTGPPAPRYAVYELQFMQEELDRFWTNVILRNKDKAVKEVH